MTAHALAAACQPDAAREWADLASLFLPGGLTPSLQFWPGHTSAECAVLGWARSGLMQLTGLPAGPPLAPPSPVLPRVSLLAAAISDLASRHGVQLRLDPAAILSGRSALHGWHRHGTASANGTCQLLRAADTWLAVSLSRPDDLATVPAILGRDLAEDPWTELRAAAATLRAAELASSARLLGVPAAILAETAEGVAPVAFHRLGDPGTAPKLALDLSAMWAGPLCSSLLRRVGWRTLKVEDPRRPDGTRSGSRQFYAGLHAGGATVQLDLTSGDGRHELRRLADQAGVIIEASRPRALRGFGLIADEWLAAAPGRVWLSITGYGRDDFLNRVAFGDDAAVAGGLVAQAAGDTPVFCGDAIADPLTGIFAALAVLSAEAAGGGMLADVAMAGVSAYFARPVGVPQQHEVIKDGRGWVVSHGDERQRVS
jgi:hypothetical protein